MSHVSDTVVAMIFMLDVGINRINGSFFNSGSSKNMYQLRALVERVASFVGDDVKLEWFGDKNIGPYNLSFDKMRQLGFSANLVAEDGVSEILEKLNSGKLDKTIKTITLDWYEEITRWHELINDLTIDGRLLKK